MLGAEGRGRLEQVPDGIHSGLAKPRARGLFFCFQAPDPKGTGKLHFWQYYDAVEDRIIDNRFIIANLIACERDTARVIGNYDVFAIQERIIENIVSSYQQQRALEEAPKSLDPLQQTLVTTIQSYMSRPEVKRESALAAIRFLNEPLLSVVVKELRSLYKSFGRSGEIGPLLDGIQRLAAAYAASSIKAEPHKALRREDLRLICFDHLCS